MKIIKPCNFRRNTRLRASPRHGGAVRYLQIYLPTLIRRGGAPSGAAGFIANNQEVKTFHYVRLSTLFLWETLRFQQIANHLFGGTVLSPESPLRFAMVCMYLLWICRSVEESWSDRMVDRDCRNIEGKIGGLTKHSTQSTMNCTFLFRPCQKLHVIRHETADCRKKDPLNTVSPALRSKNRFRTVVDRYPRR